MDAGILRKLKLVSDSPDAIGDLKGSEVSFRQLRVVGAGDGTLPEGFKLDVDPLTWVKCDVLAFGISITLHCLLCFS